MDNFEMKQLIKKGWIKTWLMFEVQATSEETTKRALSTHLEKLKKIDEIKIIEEHISETKKEKPLPQIRARGIKKVYSQVLETIILARNFEVLVELMITFAPSAIEILEPEKITLDMRNAQNALNSIADIMHKFAAAGVGGVLISNV